MKVGTGLALSAGLALLAACGTSELFGTYDLPESPDVAETDWPRLVDTPVPPPPRTYGPGYPDPAEGREIVSELGAASAAASVRAAQLGQPVLSESERSRLDGTR